jgi:hypothetical protein
VVILWCAGRSCSQSQHQHLFGRTVRGVLQRIIAGMCAFTLFPEELAPRACAQAKPPASLAIYICWAFDFRLRRVGAFRVCDRLGRTRNRLGYLGSRNVDLWLLHHSIRVIQQVEASDLICNSNAINSTQQYSTLIATLDCANP